MQPRVLICEDDPVLAWDLETLVTSSGALCVGIARDSLTARSLATDHKPNLALIDLMLLDGDTGARLAHDLASAGIRVVILSGSEDVRPALAEFSHTFAPKPLPEAVLQQLLKTQFASLHF